MQPMAIIVTMINIRERCNMQIKQMPILCFISHKVDSIVIIMITFSLVFDFLSFDIGCLVPVASFASFASFCMVVVVCRAHWMVSMYLYIFFFSPNQFWLIDFGSYTI